MVEILKQNQYVPMSVANQVSIIYAGVNGYLDDIDIEDVSKYEMELMELLSANNQSTLDIIAQSGKLEEKTEAELKKALESFIKSFSK
jgi:F-type H+-transporting ATPase subunit alpha